MPDVTLSYQTSEGSTFSALGWIHFDTRETQDFKATLELHPRGQWASLASSASPDTTGTIRKVTIDGITYDALTDTNLSETVPRFKNEAMATSNPNRNMRKMTAQAAIVKSVTIACNAIERARLKLLAETP